MRCEKFRRMLSDDMGGALAPRSKDSLSRHLSSCPSCRAYCESLLKLQSGAQGLNRGAERPDSYWRDFDARLEARLVAERAGAPVRAPRASRRIWIWSGAGLAAAAAAAAAFVLIRPEGAPPGPFVFSFEDTVSSLMLEIGDDPALESSFDRALQASLDETVGAAGEGAFAPRPDDPLFWEKLSDQDLSRLEPGLQGEKKT